MCGRFTLVLGEEEIKAEFGIQTPSAFSYQSYNISPSRHVPIIFLNDSHQQTLSMMQWGLLPSWAKDRQASPRPINARIETLNEKPTFRNAYQQRRCLVPASGFYEWDKQASPKQPYYFFSKGHCLFAFAGLWEMWKESKETLYTFTIITREAEKPVMPIHARMPVILPKDYYNPWLYGKELPEKPFPLSAYPVGLAVNSALNNQPSLILEQI